MTLAPTPLAQSLIARIARDGPLSVAGYMQACLLDPEHGYYRKRAAIGREGDFITAPEISQIYGELIGLWCAVVWQQMGSPAAVRLVELGPGRGTLMRDALRAARALPPFRDALKVVLVETNSELARLQRSSLATASVPVRWLSRLQADGAALPTIVIANEFLDALPAEQWVWRAGAWRLRCVGLDAASRLSYAEGATDDHAPVPAALTRPDDDGAIFESRAAAFADIGQSLLGLGGMLAALFIDYGHVQPALGDTLQAVRAHRYDDPLAAPGEADLTMQVDFTAFAAAMTARGLACDGPVTQAQFLGRLGIAERASRLMAANPVKAGTIETAVARLMAPVGMGTRFHAIGIRSANLPPLPALVVVDTAAPAP